MTQTKTQRCQTCRHWDQPTWQCHAPGRGVTKDGERPTMAPGDGTLCGHWLPMDVAPLEQRLWRQQRRCELCGGSLRRANKGAIVCRDCETQKPGRVQDVTDPKAKAEREMWQRATESWGKATLDREALVELRQCDKGKRRKALDGGFME